ncbi:unnamed protein product [Caenorhabditis angaria]|uniref:Uncharacterized protein n=1 Tax=Caenorhabditis angaria TaxID=860376 RepID=A0A9P1I4B1_9PELO|nr:unnamed protein product [Caenorhabditis angaria]
MEFVEYFEECIVGQKYSHLAISPDNSIIIAATSTNCEVLLDNKRKSIIKHEANVVGVFFETNTKLITITENGEITNFELTEEQVFEKKYSKRITAFPVVSVFAQKNEKEEFDFWLIMKKSDKKTEKFYDVCFTSSNGSGTLEKVWKVPTFLNTEQIVIEKNVIAYCHNQEVHAIILKKDRKIEKETQYRHDKDDSTYRFVRIAANSNYLAVSMANGLVYQWSNLKSAGVSDTFTSSHWHKVAPQVVVTKFGNVLSAGAECVLARFTKAQKLPTLLPRLIAPVVKLCLSDDSSTLLLQLEDNSIHTVLLSTMAVKESYSTMQYCPRSLNCVFQNDPAMKRYFVMNAKPGAIQWAEPIQGKTLQVMNVTKENAVDGDMSLVGIKPAFRDVSNMSLGIKYTATLEKFMNFESENHIRFWKRNIDNPFLSSLITTVAVEQDVVFVSVCQSETSKYDKTIISASTSGNISVWEISENEQDVREDLTRARNWQEASINAISTIQANGRFASAHGKHAVLWNVANMKIIDVISCEDEVLKCEFYGKYLIISHKKGVTCWDTVALLVIWRIQQRVGLFVSEAAGCFAYDESQVMNFDAETGRVLKTIKFSTPVNDLIVLYLQKAKSLVYIAKTEKGILTYRPSQHGTSQSKSKRLSIAPTPFNELAITKQENAEISEDQKFVRQPRPDAAKLFAGPVYSLPPISFLAPLFIEKSLLPPPF